MRKYSALFLLFLAAPFIQAQNYINGQAARAVLGQTNFTAGSSASSQNILGGVSGMAYYNGILYVADSNRVAATPNNSRIMAFPTSEIPDAHENLLADPTLTNTDCYLCGFNASFSLGQSSFSPTNTTCPTSINPCFVINRTQNGLANATGVATDGHYFAVADTDNNRVLLWNEVPTAMDQNADVVIGQTGFTTFKTPQVVDKYSLRGPQGVWIQNGKLFVADSQNNRVLIWNTIPTQNNQGADLVLGQVDFTHNSQPAPGPGNPVAAANQLLNPTSVTSDSTRLYIADLGFNRVLIWNSIPTTIDQNADVVVGQPDLTQTAANNANVCNGYNIGPVAECQTSLNYPRFALSNGTKLFISDGGNDRVLIWDTIPTTNGAPATGVLGEPDFLQDVVSSASISITSTAIDNTGGVDLLPTPQALAYDPATQNLYVSDPYNRRVVVFTPGDTSLPSNSIVNWASEIIRQEGLISLSVTTGGTITAADSVSVTIGGGTAYSYTEKSTDTTDTIAQALVNNINASNSGAGDPYVTAIFDGNGTGTIYFSSKNTDLAFDSISLSATASNTANITVTTSGAYLSAGTAATGSLGMIVEINGTNLSDQTLTATMDGTHPLPNALGGVQVFMDGFAAPLLKVSPSQIITQIPYGYSDRNSTSVYVRTQHSGGPTTISNAEPVYIAPANPGLFNAPAYAGQARPWPITQAFHQAGNSSAVVSIDGSVTAGNIATITIAGVAYNYTVVAADTLTTITQNLINLINATDSNVTASLGGAFTRVVLTAKKPGAAGDGISISGSISTNATVSVTAYNSVTCCVVTPNSPIIPGNPAAPGELIQVYSVGLGTVTDPTNTAQYSLNTAYPYMGPVPNTVPEANFVTATMGGTTAQVIFSGLPSQSYGIYNIQMIVPTGLATSATTPLYVAQNAFISNTVTIPVGPPVLYTPAAASAPATTIQEVIETPNAGATVSGTYSVSGWALNTVSGLSGVNISIDGQFIGNGTLYPRADVCAAHTSPGCPNVGWYLSIDTTQFADGEHTLALTALSANGSNYTISENFVIANGATPADSGLHASIDAPGPTLFYRGSVSFSGWSVNTASSLAGVSIYVDSVPQGAATLSPRADVCAIYTCTNANVGWSFQFGTSKISDGQHTLVAKAIYANGQKYATSQTFQVANFSSASTTHAVIEAPSPTAGAFSGLLGVSGWAVDDASPVASVYVSVDGVSYGAASYGSNRPDVCASFNDAGCPNVGFAAYVDTTLLTDGTHTLTVTVNLGGGRGGQSSTYTQTFTTANLTSSNPVTAIIDQPTASSTVTGLFTASGWAVSSADAVTTVALLVDGKSFGNAVYGLNRPDVCAAKPGSVGCPNVGWSANLNSGLLANGSHTLEATVTTASGHRASLSTAFAVANPTTGPGRISFDSPSGVSNPFMGKALFAGWALNDNAAVSSLTISIDGVPYGTATYGLPRADVCANFPGRPGCPNVGWNFGFDTTMFPDGNHTLGLTENNADGSSYTSSVVFNIANYTNANGNPMQLFIETPVNTTSYGIFGTIAISGWAIDGTNFITAVNLAIDGVPIGTANYGLARADVCLAYPGRPGCPNVGWNFVYNTQLIPNGIHTLSVTGVTPTGQSSTTSQQFNVAN